MTESNKIKVLFIHGPLSGQERIVSYPVEPILHEPWPECSVPYACAMARYEYDAQAIAYIFKNIEYY
jgi:hypothetical protein